MNKIIIILITSILLFNTSSLYAESNIHYTKADTMFLLTKKDVYSASFLGNTLNASGLVVTGVLVGVIVGKLLYKKNYLGIMYSAVAGGFFGLITGASLIDKGYGGKKVKNYDKYKLMKMYKKKYIKNKLLIGYLLAQISDVDVCRFLLKEYNEMIMQRYINLSKSRKKSYNQFAQVNAFALVNNDFNLDPLFSSSLNTVNKNNVLHFIPYCVNIINLDDAIKFLKRDIIILRDKEFSNEIYLSDQYYEFLTAHLLTRRNSEDYNKLIKYYNTEDGIIEKFWMGFALADYKYDGSIENLIEAYNTIDIGEYRYYALLGLTNFETPQVREVMENALTDNYVPPNKLKSKDEERFVIRGLARGYLDR